MMSSSLESVLIDTLSTLLREVGELKANLAELKEYMQKMESDGITLRLDDTEDEDSDSDDDESVASSPF